MAIELINVRSLEGPNIFYAQPAVMLSVRAREDLRGELSERIKHWAQAVGVVVGYIRGEAYALKDGDTLTQLSFICSLPIIGAEIGAAVVADLQAEERGDDEHSHDELLLQLIRRRQREDPPLPLLQLRAEALARRFPLFSRPDGRLVLGLGSRGWSFDSAGLSMGMELEPPWQEIGVVPLVAVGGAEAEMVAAQLVDMLHEHGRVVALGTGGFDAARAAMADEQAEVIIVTIDPAMVLERGLPFERCSMAVVGSLEGLDQPSERAAGLHALTVVPDGCVILNADDPSAVSLVARTGASVTLASEEGYPVRLAEHVAAGRRGVWLEENNIILSEGDRRTIIDTGQERRSLLALSALDVLV